MSTDPYDQQQDDAFDRITNPYQDPEVEWIDPSSDELWNAYITQSNISSLVEVPNSHRHPGGRTMPRPDAPRTSRDQATLLLGCGGFLLLTALAVAVIIVAWRW